MSEIGQYAQITTAALAADDEFFKYLWAAQIKTGNRGGTFIGNRTVAPAAFRKYGIVLPKGGMILPHVEPDALRGMLKGANTYESDQEFELDRDVEYVIEPDELVQS